MATDSNVQVRLRLLGRQAFSAAARGAGADLRHIDNSAKGAGRGLDGAGRATTRTERAMARLSSGGGLMSQRQLVAVGNAATVAAAAVGAAGVVLGRMAWDYNVTQDAQQVSFTALLGSRRKALEMQKEILALSRESPILDPKSTGNAVRSLMAYGISAKQVIPLTKALGDMSAASGRSIEEVMPRAALALGQIEGKGKLQAQEMNQLAESVGLSRKAIRKELGLTAKEFEETFTPGNNIKSSEALPAIMRAMKNQSAGAADDLAKTTQGRIARLREVIAQESGQMLRPVFDAVGAGAGVAGDWLMANGDKIKATLSTIVDGVSGVVTQIIDAVAPAMPFVENVLLPLGRGIAEGVIGGIVIAFKIAVPIIKGISTALGWVGQKLAPLAPVFRTVGQVIGVIFGGAILGVLGKVPKVGKVFSLLNAPLRLVGGAFRFVGRVIGTVWRAFVTAHQWVSRFVGTFTGAPARLARAALNIVGGIIHKIETLPGKLLTLGGKAISGLGSGIKSMTTTIAKKAVDIGKAIAAGIATGIAEGATGVFEAINDLIPGSDAVSRQGDPADVSNFGKDKGLLGLGFMGLATGGHVTQPGWAVVGERGPELVHLGGGATVYDAGQTANAQRAAAPMAGRSSSIYLTNVIQLDGRDVHQSVRRHEQRLQEIAA